MERLEFIQMKLHTFAIKNVYTLANITEKNKTINSYISVRKYSVATVRIYKCHLVQLYKTLNVSL